MLSLSRYPSRRIRSVCRRPRLGGGRGGLLPSPPLAMPAGHAVGRSVGASREACEQKHQRVRALGGAMRREATEIPPRRLSATCQAGPEASVCRPALRFAECQTMSVPGEDSMPKFQACAHPWRGARAEKRRKCGRALRQSKRGHRAFPAAASS